MMTVADLTKDKEPFSGDLFASTAISYNDMVNVNYETDQLAQLERAEQQIDEILTARRQDKRDQAALEALTAVHSGPGEIGEYDPNAVVVASAEDRYNNYYDNRFYTDVCTSRCERKVSVSG